MANHMTAAEAGKGEELRHRDCNSALFTFRDAIAPGERALYPQSGVPVRLLLNPRRERWVEEVRPAETVE